MELYFSLKTRTNNSQAYWTPPLVDPSENWTFSEIEDSTKTHAVLLSSPGLGHLFPVLELGKCLRTLDFKVPIFVISSRTSATESQVIESFKSLNRCEVILLPPPDISHLVHPDAVVVTRLAVVMRETRPAFSSALSALSFPPTFLIVDLFGCEHMEVSDEFKIQKLVYIPSHAWFLALTLHLPILHESVKGEYVDEKNTLFIPGCKPLLPEDVVDPMLCRSYQQYLEYLNIAIKIPMADAILLNTWEELEPATLAALRDHKLWGGISKVPVYPVGPMLSNEKMIELALGLELSQQRFIWVIRPPAESNDDLCFTVRNSSHGDEGLASYLPEAFLERTKTVGFIISELGSTRQRMNATLLAEEVRIAVRLKSPWKGIVGREEIKMMVKTLMVDEEGHAMRGRVKELTSSGERTRSDNGSSAQALAQLMR
ncbi:Anthocyanidin 3-O-glucosyltransferase 5 [Hibiscus syriacus]|uniref:Anthocyanidin 3-O-glucosyltransferase 5 n=1 Tax=Hibiscus syriacus TaxID=106335 RepID=A0A6A3AIX4_HIBSY|nr:Anthocyanidin 3-O-glucosyltransferase 5 [Hibiscus syriacus]